TPVGTDQLRKPSSELTAAVNVQLKYSQSSRPAHHCCQRSGTRDGPSIRGGTSRRTCSSMALQSGVSDHQSKLSKLMPPRSFAMRLTQTTKLFDFLLNISRFVTVRAAPFLRTSFAATRCCSARNCISVSTTLVFAEAEAGLCQNSSRLILDVFKLPFACNISSTVCPIIV